MKKHILAATVATAMIAGPAAAFEVSNDDCEVHLKGDMSWNAGTLTINSENHKKIVINADREVTVNGRSLSLDDEQQEWVNTYYEQIDTAIPMTLSITYDALELAGSAINEAFGELFGTDSGLVTDLDDMFADLKQEMDSHFYDENGQVKVNTKDFDEDGWFSDRWEDQFENRVEDIVSQSTGRILMAIGAQMLSGGDGIDEFEARMENWEDDFEQRIEAKSSAIEARADALCEVLQKADYAENKMAKHIDGLEQLDMFTVDADKSMKM